MAFQMRNIANFGTSEPWVARLWIGVLEIRDVVYVETERVTFDQKYDLIIQNLHECFNAMRLLHKTLADHEAKARSQEIFQLQNNNLVATESIDITMNQALKDFFIKGNIAINHIFPLSKFMGCNIGFLREKEDKHFERGACKFLSKVPAAQELIEILRDNRATWFKGFLDLRDKIEHESPQRLTVHYSVESDKVNTQFPLIDNIGLVDLTKKLWEYLFEFVEDIVGQSIESKIASSCQNSYRPGSKARSFDAAQVRTHCGR